MEPLGPTRAEASDAASYAPGQIVTFRRGSREQRLSRGRAYRVESIDAEAGTVSLATPQGKAVRWSPACWGEHAEAFVEVEQELRTGDRIQFTRNNRRAGRLNGHTASVVGIDPQRGGITVERKDDRVRCAPERDWLARLDLQPVAPLRRGLAFRRDHSADRRNLAPQHRLDRHGTPTTTSTSIPCA